MHRPFFATTTLLIAFGMIVFVSYRIGTMSRSSTPSSDTDDIQTADSSPLKKKPVDVPLTEYSNPMPSQEKLISVSPEYAGAHQVWVKSGQSEVVPGIPDLTLRLVDVVSDGRCPSGVNCGIAGWATATVEVKYKDSTRQEEVHIQGGGQIFYRTPSEKDARPGSGSIIRIGDYVIYAAALMPYPERPEEKIEKKDYAIGFFVDTKEHIEMRKGLTELAWTEFRKHAADHSKYYIYSIKDVSGLHTEQKEVTFYDPMDTTAKKYFVTFSWQQAWVVTEFKEESLSPATDFESSDYKLLDQKNFPEVRQQEVIRAIIERLGEQGENPADFFARFEDDQVASRLTVTVTHKDTFQPGKRYTIGNPSGKDRIARYNLTTKELEFLLVR